MANTKLLKVMDYLINEQEDKARELLHQIFIEKARAIHEEMMANDDLDEEMLGGDQGEKLTDEIEADMNEIDAEEHYGPGTMEAEDDDLDVEDAEEDLSDELEDMETDAAEIEDADDVDMDMDSEEDVPADDEELEADSDMADADHEESSIQDLEQAIAELKAEFEQLKHETHADMDSDEHANMDHAADHDADSEEDVKEAWESDDWDSDFDDLAENVELDLVHAAKSGEVGAGKFAPAETNKRSPVPSTQTDTMGARAVKMGQGPKASGYEREKAPESKSLNLSNRRKDADQGKHPVSKEGNSAALLNKDTSAGYGAVNTRSPISGRK